MGTKLIQQRRGKGSPAFRTPAHRFFKEIRYSLPKGARRGQVIEFVDDPAHGALIAGVVLDTGGVLYNIAAEGLAIGDRVEFGENASVKAGNILFLSSIPEGVPVFNIELVPGDGGKVARSTGATAYVVSHDEESGLVSLRFSSKAVRALQPNCLATIGVACGGGRLEKPLKKAGSGFYKARATNRYWPRVRGTAMSAYDHPHGGKSLGKPSTVARSTPPGRKVGHVAARRTGRRKKARAEEKKE